MAEEEVNVSGNIEIQKTTSSNSSIFQLPQQLYMTTPAAKEWIGQKRENIRPWTVFINTNNFKVPSNLPRLSKRIMRNIEYFQSNYLFVFIGLVIYCLLTSPLLLIAVAISLTVGYKLSKKQNERKLVILGHELTLAQQYGVVAICSIPLFIWAGAGAAVFWVIVSFALISLEIPRHLYKLPHYVHLCTFTHHYVLIFNSFSFVIVTNVHFGHFVIFCTGGLFLLLVLFKFGTTESRGASLMIIRTRASEIYTSYIRTVGLALLGFIIVLRTIIIDFLFIFCLYYIGASFFIITLHAAFYNIEAIIKTEDSFGLLEEV